jgi:hypothetical protein
MLLQLLATLWPLLLLSPLLDHICMHTPPSLLMMPALLMVVLMLLLLRL